MEKYEEIPIKHIRRIENSRTKFGKQEIRDLMDNIKQHGLLHPIRVWKLEKDDYVVVFGNSRLEACEKLGWKTILAEVIKEEYDETTLLLENVSENVHRTPIFAAELGRVCKILQEKGLSLEQIAVRLSMSADKCRKALRIYDLVPKELQKDVVFATSSNGKENAGKISAGTMNSIINLYRKHGFSKKIITDLANIVKKTNMNYDHMQLVALLLKKGLTVPQAMKESENYTVTRTTFTYNKKEVEKLIKENDLQGSFPIKQLVEKILRGDIPGNKKLLL